MDGACYIADTAVVRDSFPFQYDGNWTNTAVIIYSQES